MKRLSPARKNLLMAIVAELILFVMFFPFVILPFTQTLSSFQLGAWIIFIFLLLFPGVYQAMGDD